MRMMIRKRTNSLRFHGALLVGLLTLTVFVLTGCGGAPVILSGTVIDAYTGAPINAASVLVGQNQLATNPDGMFSTPNWKPSDVVQVAAPGYEPVAIPLESQPQISQTSVPTITIETLLRPNTLSGIVNDLYSGAPLAGAQVSAQIDASRTLSATTDAEGRYTLTETPEQFRLIISAPEYAPVEADVQRMIAYDARLRPNVISGIVTDRYSDQPVAGATVQAGTATATTGADGAYRIADLPEGVTAIAISAEGYAELDQQFEPGTRTVNAVLRPDMLTATLVDEVSGDPIANATVIATTTLLGNDVAFVRIDNSPDGRFTLNGLPESGYIQVLAPGYRKQVLEIKPGSIPTQIALEPFVARALYVKTSTAAYRPSRMQEFFDVIDRTELNAMVLDLKSDNLEDLGLIYYASEVPIIQELGTSRALMDVRGILAEAKRRNVYMIARIHIFAHDNLLAQTRPDWAAQDIRTGKEFYADWNIAWLDPWNRNVWDYNIQLAVEAAHMGFDEIQFDYIRFPNDARDMKYMRLSQPHDPKVNSQEMYQNIATFMEQAHRAINGAGAFFSVDVFGYAAWAPQALIGQNLAMMAPHADYVYPMVYPSHFYVNELGFENAAAHPYEIVYESLVRGAKLTEGKRALLRPWLQDFTLIWVPRSQIVRYGVREVRAQIDASDDFGAAGWALWSADNLYTYDALKPEQ